MSVSDSVVSPVASTSALLPPSVSPFSTPSSTKSLSIGQRLHREQPIINDPLSRDFPDLANITQEDLTALLEDPALFDAYLNTTPQALEMHQTYEQRLKANIEIAEQNEALRPKLEGLRGETARLFHEASELRDRSTYLDEAQREAFRRYQPAAQQARLQHATTAQEYLSEQLVNAFLDGHGDEDSFSRQYREVRKVYHRRAILADKWSTGKVVWRT